MGKNRWISDLHWVRQGQQTRSQKTQAALLDAAETLFGEQGIDSTAVSDVACRAGCSVGAVYHHFKDKQTLLYALVERMVEESIATSEHALDPARWEGATLTDILQGYLEFSLTEGRVHTRFKSALLEIARQDQTIHDQLHRLSNSTRLMDLLLTRKDEVGHLQPELALRMVLDQFNALLRNRAGESPYEMHTKESTDEIFVTEALKSAQAYLQIKV